VNIIVKLVKAESRRVIQHVLLSAVLWSKNGVKELVIDWTKKGGLRYFFLFFLVFMGPCWESVN